MEAEAKAKQAAEREKMKFMMDQRKMLEEQLAKVSAYYLKKEKSTILMDGWMNDLVVLQSHLLQNLHCPNLKS